MQAEFISSHSTGRRDIFLLVILALSLALNVLPGWKVQSMSNHIEARRNKVIEGLTISAIAAVGIDGEEKTIACAAGDQPTVLYIFSPTCVWCDRNLDNVRALKGKIEQSHKFIGISLSSAGLNDYMNSHQLDFPIYKQPSQEAIKQLGLGSTPQTIVISPQGKVLKNWVGAYGSSKPEVEAYFGLKLPGVAESQ
ncbi:MAG: TlpA disulfide reductase family protein [Acidobacteriota bacterium]